MDDRAKSRVRLWLRSERAMGQPSVPAPALPEVTVTAKGKQKRAYRWYATPFEILRQLPGVAGFLRSDLTLDDLTQSATRKSDTQAAAEMQEAKRKLFARLKQKRSA